MKILVACFSLTGKTELIAKKLAKSLGADYVSLEPVKWKSKFAAYTVGLLLAQRRWAVEILPLEDVDVDSYDCVVVSGPVWGRRSGAGAQRVYPSVPAGGKANLRPAFLRPGGKIRVEAFAGGAGGCGHQMPVGHYREGGE